MTGITKKLFKFNLLVLLKTTRSLDTCSGSSEIDRWTCPGLSGKRLNKLCRPAIAGRQAKIIPGITV